MSVNQVSFDGQARSPRGQVLLNGNEVKFVSFKVDTNGYHAADTASVTLAADALPDGSSITQLLALTTIPIEIKAGFASDPNNASAADFTSLFVGHVDKFTYDPISGTLDCTCRDLTAPMLDTKTTEEFRNKTASQVVETIAGRHGLTPVVHSTSTLVGTLYNTDHVRVHSARTEWDLLTWLAREEDFVVFVSGRELHFEPLPDEGADPYVFRVEPATQDRPKRANFVTMRLEKDLALAKGVKVEVRSWNPRNGRPYTKTAGSGSSDDVTFYRYSIPGLRPEQAQARAQALYNEISQHQVRASIDGPADNLLKLTIPIKIEGTPFDQVLFCESISREMSFSGGYHWTVTAKNRVHGDQAAQAPSEG